MSKKRRLRIKVRYSSTKSVGLWDSPDRLVVPWYQNEGVKVRGKWSKVTNL
ncbi:hypothetical protein [Sphingobacterium sp. NPDC055431]